MPPRRISTFMSLGVFLHLRVTTMLQCENVLAALLPRALPDINKEACTFCSGCSRLSERAWRDAALSISLCCQPHQITQVRKSITERFGAITLTDRSVFGGSRLFAFSPGAVNDKHKTFPVSPAHGVMDQY